MRPLNADKSIAFGAKFKTASMVSKSVRAKTRAMRTSLLRPWVYWLIKGSERLLGACLLLGVEWIQV
ncbi:hypothetical protein PCANC_25869 [Puccinia coronata f. sp. avenae]|uniref:Uncharacterized protein n=1 Tax=Puccinia coronata f. sp. avenae TaxID=200324 RepID=A0A2N5TKF4_9BASI|nr:hypothetical protein PCANC_25869 [Puccinia coronata f. sp. avenae]